MRPGSKEAQGHGDKLGMRNQRMAARRDGQLAVSGRWWLTSVVWKSDKKGKGSFSRRGFYSRRRERELEVGPHVGVNG
jgi:hypothetical protein